MTSPGMASSAARWMVRSGAALVPGSESLPWMATWISAARMTAPEAKTRQPRDTRVDVIASLLPGHGQEGTLPGRPGGFHAPSPTAPTAEPPRNLFPILFVGHPPRQIAFSGNAGLKYGREDHDWANVGALSTGVVLDRMARRPPPEIGRGGRRPLRARRRRTPGARRPAGAVGPAERSARDAERGAGLHGEHRRYTARDELGGLSGVPRRGGPGPRRHAAPVPRRCQSRSRSAGARHHLRPAVRPGGRLPPVRRPRGGGLVRSRRRAVPAEGRRRPGPPPHAH